MSDPTNQQQQPPTPQQSSSPGGTGAVAGAPAGTVPGNAPAAVATTTADTEELRAQMLADRFDAVAARAGIDEGYTDVALELFRKTGKEPTKANLTAFCTDLKKTRPALFGPQPAQTSPTPTTAAPATPAPGAVATPHQQWQALRAAGRHAEAEAFWKINHRAIKRTA